MPEDIVPWLGGHKNLIPPGRSDGQVLGSRLVLACNIAEGHRFLKIQLISFTKKLQRLNTRRI